MPTLCDLRFSECVTRVTNIPVTFGISLSAMFHSDVPSTFIIIVTVSHSVLLFIGLLSNSDNSSLPSSVSPL